VNLIQQFRHILTNQDTEGVFLRLMLAVTVIASMSHLAFILLFDSAGVVWLSRVNVGSLLLYVLSALLIQQDYKLTAITLIAAEIILHGILAVYVIGWDSGFHFYIILIIPVAIVSTLHRPPLKVLAAVGTGLLYIALDILFRGRAPHHALPAHILSGLYYFNLASTLVILALLATLYFRLVASAEARLRLQACTDPLTQLRNRRFAMEAAQHEAAVFQRGGRPLALVIGDVDHFKRINDKHGHETGDVALKAVAQALNGGVREVDHVARWGGEEFLMLLPATEADEALRVSERLREAVQALDLRHNGAVVSVTITLGVSVLNPDETVEQALARADQALYRGKQDGRNRVVWAGQA
jgi:diguanylate cyclase (GGDEF)-like protein